MFLSFEIVPHLSPKVSRSLFMKEDLSFELHAHEVKVPFSTVQHISPNEKIENVDDVLNFLSVLNHIFSKIVVQGYVKETLSVL